MESNIIKKLQEHDTIKIVPTYHEDIFCGNALVDTQRSIFYKQVGASYKLITNMMLYNYVRENFPAEVPCYYHVAKGLNTFMFGGDILSTIREIPLGYEAFNDYSGRSSFDIKLTLRPLLKDGVTKTIIRTHFSLFRSKSRTSLNKILASRITNNIKAEFISMLSKPIDILRVVELLGMLPDKVSEYFLANFAIRFRNEATQTNFDFLKLIAVSAQFGWQKYPFQAREYQEELFYKLYTR